MSDNSDSDSWKEDETTMSDNDDMMDHYDDDDDDYEYGTKKFMPDLLPNEELSGNTLQKITNRFSQAFTQRYPTSELRFFEGSFDDAVNCSILNLEDPRPLMFYIRDDRSAADNIFCEKFFHSKEIVDLLNEQFVLWPWDRTDMAYYRLFLELLFEKLGSKLASEVDSYSNSNIEYPLLLCLSKNHNQYTVSDYIDSKVQDEGMMHSMLCAARYTFDHQNVNLDEDESTNWHIANSQLTLISRPSDGYKGIADSLKIEERKIISVKKIENIMWSIQYASEKKRMHSPNEKEVFYGCPSSMTDAILRKGFDLDNNCIHGKKHGYGLYFSSDRNICEEYKLSDETRNDSKAIIICRILLDQSNSTSNIFILHRNQQILPEYLVIYNK